MSMYEHLMQDVTLQSVALLSLGQSIFRLPLGTTTSSFGDPMDYALRAEKALATK